MNTGRLILWKSLSKRFYSNWSSVKELRQYLVSMESLKLTKGPFETRILIKDRDIQTAQSLTYRHFKEANWTWLENNSTGFQIYETHDGIKCVTDKFEDQSIWIAVCKENEICGVDRLTCKLEERQTLDVLQYMQNDILWENQLLLSYLKSKRLIEFERLFVKPEYRQQGMFLMIFWCASKASYLAGVDGVCTATTINLQNFYQNFKRWEFDYGDGVKTNFFYLQSHYLPECANNLEKLINNIYT